MDLNPLIMSYVKKGLNLFKLFQRFETFLRNSVLFLYLQMLQKYLQSIQANVH